MVIEELKTLTVGAGSRRLDILGNFVRLVRFHFSALFIALLVAWTGVGASGTNITTQAVGGVLDLSG